MRHTSLLRAAGVLLAASALFAPGRALCAEAPPKSPEWSPQLAYVLTNPDTRAKLCVRLALNAEKRAAVTTIGRRLYTDGRKLQRESDRYVANDALSLEQKRDAVASMRYNVRLKTQEDAAFDKLAAQAATSAAGVRSIVDAVWNEDASLHSADAAAASAKAGMSASSVNAMAPLTYHVFATWFDADSGVDPVHVALPDKYLKFANRRASFPDPPAGYPGSDYRVNLAWEGHKLDGVKVLDVGPWNIDDNYWNLPSDPDRPRRKFTDLPLGMPESQAAYFDKYNNGKNLTHGQDQFGREVLNPAGIDLTTQCARNLGLSDNKWIDVTYLWESKLDLSGAVKSSTGPYFTGQNFNVNFTVKNVGGMSGRWEGLAYTMRAPQGQWLSATPSSGPFTLAPGAARTFSMARAFSQEGTWTCYVSALRAGVWYGVGPTTRIKVAKRTFSRVQGTTRYDTAVEFSKRAYPNGAPGVVIATGRNYPDALAAIALAGAESGPLLLVPDVLPAPVAAEVARLKPSKIDIVGGVTAVSEQVEEQLEGIAPSATVGLEGADRYDTAAKVAEAVKRKDGSIPAATAFVATGRNFPDALAATPIAMYKNWPILFAERDKLPTATADAIKSLGVTRVVVLGDKTAVGDNVMSRLPNARRAGGASRYDTAVRVADVAATNGLSYGYIALASGVRWPDAVTGGVLTARRRGIMLLTPGNELGQPMWDRLVSKRTICSWLEVYGSTDTVTDHVVSLARTTLR